MNLALDPRTRTATYKLGIFAVIAASALIAACGGGGEDDASAPLGANPPAGNQAPAISGTPNGTVMQSSAYSFTPSATDANNDTLTFSIVNLPSWASFNATTGALTGTPTNANVGNYQNIQISVSDGHATTSLAPFSINVVASASGAATLSWVAPTQNTDGTQLTDLANYRIHWGTSQNDYPNAKTVPSSAGTTTIVDQLTPNTYYFVVTAVDIAGNESVYSNVATKTVL